MRNIERFRNGDEELKEKDLDTPNVHPILME